MQRVEIVILIKNKLLAGKTFADLFCGIGGFHLALSSFGADCVFASDIDVYASSVYEKNFNIKPYGDINEIKLKQIPYHDILCAGFPCQPFSISGQRQGFDDEHGRGKLFFNIVKIAKRIKPKIIILENVGNLKNHNNGKTYSTIKESLEAIGYNVFSEILCASDYEVPQARKRLYIVAIQKKYGVTEFVFPAARPTFKVIGDILLNGVNDHIITQNYTFFEKALENTSREKKVIRIGQTGLGRQGERIYAINGQAITLSAQGGGPGGKTGMYYVDNIVRKLHPRECARLMGFPDEYILAESDGRCYTQLGNSVVVDVIQYIILEIINEIGGL